MTARRTPAWDLLAGLFVTAGGLALVTGRAELVGLAVAAGLWLAVAATGRPPKLSVVAADGPMRAGVGLPVELVIELLATARPVAVKPMLPEGLELTGAVVTEPADRVHRWVVRVTVVGRRPGRYPVTVRVVTGDVTGLVEREFNEPAVVTVIVDPALRRDGVTLPAPRTRQSLGEHHSRRRGIGVELAEVTPYRPGDDPRRIHWRVTARRGEPWVALRHPDDTATLLLVLDTLADERWGAPWLTEALSAAALLADRHLARRDRVGLVAFGGVIRHLAPSSHWRQREVLLHALQHTRADRADHQPLGIAAIPKRLLSGQPHVVAFSPLVDEQLPRLLADMRRRHLDVSLTFIDPASYLPPADDHYEHVAVDLWLAERHAVADELAAIGVHTATWDTSRSVEPVLERIARSWQRT